MYGLPGFVLQGRSARLFKALLAASLAMLACCVAASWAGPVAPASSPERVQAVIESGAAGLGASHRSVAGGLSDDRAPLLESVVIEGFVPTSLSASYEGGTSSLRAATAVGEPLPAQAQPAVIPLPYPLYAAAVLLVLAIGARRAIARACHA